MCCESLVNVTKLLSCVNLSLPIQNDKKLKIIKIKGRNIKFVESGIKENYMVRLNILHLQQKVVSRCIFTTLKYLQGTLSKVYIGTKVDLQESQN